MKIIKYRIRREANFGTDRKPQLQEIFIPVILDWNEINEETARKEAFCGEYSIEDDGKSEPSSAETADEVLNALLGVRE